MYFLLMFYFILKYFESFGFLFSVLSYLFMGKTSIFCNSVKDYRVPIF